jgi:hypothetical protein
VVATLTGTRRELGKVYGWSGRREIIPTPDRLTTRRPYAAYMAQASGVLCRCGLDHVVTPMRFAYPQIKLFPLLIAIAGPVSICSERLSDGEYSFTLISIEFVRVVGFLQAQGL